MNYYLEMIKTGKYLIYISNANLQPALHESQQFEFGGYATKFEFPAASIRIDRQYVLL